MEVGVLSICRNAVSVFYSLSRLGCSYFGSKINSSPSLDNKIVNRVLLENFLFGKRSIMLETNIAVYKVIVVLITLVWTGALDALLIQNNQLDSFHKNCLHTVCGYKQEDKISITDSFAKCQIGGIENFL